MFDHSQDDGKLELGKAFTIAESLHTAQVDSDAYQQAINVNFTAAMKKENCNEVNDSGEDNPTIAATATISHSNCYYCGRQNH